MNRLTWQWLGGGVWCAYSVAEDMGCRFEYEIAVCDDGTFDVSESDTELVGTEKIPTFATLAEAKKWCEEKEAGFYQMTVASTD